MTLMDLADGWAIEAASLERWGDDRGATILRQCATELNAAARAHDDEEFTITAASAASGYSCDHLRALVASGEIPNAGRKGAPRIRRADLPRKAKVTSNGFDAGAEARSILGAGR